MARLWSRVRSASGRGRKYETPRSSSSGAGMLSYMTDKRRRLLPRAWGTWRLYGPPRPHGLLRRYVHRPSHQPVGRRAAAARVRKVRDVRGRVIPEAADVIEGHAEGLFGVHAARIESGCIRRITGHRVDVRRLIDPGDGLAGLDGNHVGRETAVGHDDLRVGI